MDEQYTIRQWPKLRDAGVPALLRKAATMWDTYEFAQFVSYSKAEHSVDSWAALKLAAGSKFESLNILPKNRSAAFDGAVAFVESAVGKDLYRWNDEPGRTKEEVIALYNRLADELEATT